jgi:hypothetical protein
MAAYNIMQDKNLDEVQESHGRVKKMWNESFRQIKKLDIVKLIREFNDNPNKSYDDPTEMMNDARKSIETKLTEIKGSLDHVVRKMENQNTQKKEKDPQTVDYYFAKVLLDNIKQREVILKYH